MSERYVTGLLAAVSSLALLCVMFLIPVPYVLMSPGPAFNTLGKFGDKPLFTITGAPTYAVSGEIDFTTVEITNPRRKVMLGEAVAGWLVGDNEVLPRDLIYGKQSAAASDKESAAELADSKMTSEVAALRAAGFTVPEKTVVASVAKDAPAAGQLKAGDVITAVDGKPAATTAAVSASVADRAPGDRVRLSVVRSGTSMLVDLATVKAPDGKARVGITIRPKLGKLPVDIANNIDDSVGGPSAGTMFALAIYDLLTPGSLTGGLHVAGTGAITTDGIVQPIGGINQKIAGAAHKGATVFFVPADNCAEVAPGRRGIKLVRIATLTDAINALKTLAGNPKAAVPSCSSAGR